MGPSPGDPFGFNRYDYANNNPIVNIDPDGRKCSTVDGEASCTYDGFKDENGKAISRKKAMSSGSWLAKLVHADGKHRILRTEAAMTKKYVAAKNLAAKGGSVTIKGNGELGIPDQTESGSTIVSQMETIQTIATAQEGPKDLLAFTPIGPGEVTSSGPILFYRDGAKPLNFGQTFGHEILHTVYSGAGLPNRGWANPNYKYEHQTPFNDASDAIH